MKTKKVPWITRAKKSFATALRGFKKMAGDAQQKIDVDAQFSRQALRWDRMSTGMVNLDPTFLGIFDQGQSTLTVRAQDALRKGELVESEHIQYRIETIQPGRIQLPVEVDQTTHLVPCKVAVLARI